GQLTLVDNQINANTATLRLKAVFPNSQKLLWPNQFVKSRLLLTTRKDALVVPATVPQRGPDGLFAYVIQPDQTVQPRNIEVDHTEGDLVILAKGLQEGEQVVVDGQNQLRAGAQVTPRQAGQRERPFGQMRGLPQMTSISSSGTSQVTLQFEPDRTTRAAEQDVQAAINAAPNPLPPTLPAPPTYSKSNPADVPVLTLSVTSKSL